MKHIDLLKECVQVTTDRGEQYGTIDENFAATSEILLAMYGIKLSPKDCVKVLIANKYARQRFKPKEDNIVDIINYVAIEESLKCTHPEMYQILWLNQYACCNCKVVLTDDQVRERKI